MYLTTVLFRTHHSSREKEPVWRQEEGFLLISAERVGARSNPGITLSFFLESNFLLVFRFLLLSPDLFFAFFPQFCLVGTECHPPKQLTNGAEEKPWIFLSGQRGPHKNKKSAKSQILAYNERCEKSKSPTRKNR